MVIPPAAPPVEEIKVAEKTVIPAAPDERRQLTISITQTSNQDSDVAVLYGVVNALKEFPGEDEVSLSLRSQEEVVNLKLTSITTGYCPDLHQQLVELVGEDGVRVETIAGPFSQS